MNLQVSSINPRFRIATKPKPMCSSDGFLPLSQSLTLSVSHSLTLSLSHSLTLSLSLSLSHSLTRSLSLSLFLSLFLSLSLSLCLSLSLSLWGGSSGIFVKILLTDRILHYLQYPELRDSWYTVTAFDKSSSLEARVRKYYTRAFRNKKLWPFLIAGLGGDTPTFG